MPSIIAYETVMRTAGRMQLLCVYHNSGAYAFKESQQTFSVGWIGPDDPTIRPEARPLVRHVPAPYEANLARLFIRAWCEVVPAQAWVMPTSHWAYELQFGSREWMPALLQRLGLTADELSARSQADAIAFEPGEAPRLEEFAAKLLAMLRGSDFSVLFPPYPLVARLHHHKQIWWTSTDSALIEAIEARLPGAV